ncbi:MAG TPA: type II toxin-antitoxin system RelE/ParE family toxin [Candidatus Acidoferrales bacterium]|nr:type II toxin-antitoxin system RelE/ParE family toxin [Candidatus Acidoferrales bacterium]
MTWTIVVAKAAQKQLKGIPARDLDKITTGIRAMAANPFHGDIVKLEGGENGYRRRVGSFRVFFRVDRASRIVQISAILRRTSTTY